MVSAFFSHLMAVGSLNPSVALISSLASSNPSGWKYLLIGTRCTFSLVYVSTAPML